MYEQFGKRALDVFLSATAVVVLSPILIATGLAIRLEDGGPVIYRQSRIGKHGREFTIFKFRSMPTNTAVAPSAAMGGARVTRVGRLIRRSNVDELPQLFNILRGDMAIVGPRPALPTQETLVEKRSAGSALKIRPGLTGLAQVRAYDGMTESAKAVYDNQYADSIRIGRDIKIIAATVGYLFKPPPTY